MNLRLAFGPLSRQRVYLNRVGREIRREWELHQVTVVRSKARQCLRDHAVCHFTQHHCAHNYTAYTAQPMAPYGNCKLPHALACMMSWYWNFLCPVTWNHWYTYYCSLYSEYCYAICWSNYGTVANFHFIILAHRPVTIEDRSPLPLPST